MSVGSILVGIALSLLVSTYLLRPFRAARMGTNLNQAIEVWVEQMRAGYTAEEEDAVRFCPRCGRRAGPEDRFCAGCGKPLGREAG